MVELQDELHANTRRSRITYRARYGDTTLALKCYRRPLWGLIHWLRAQRRGIRLRQLGAPVPDLLFSGWLKEQACFGYGTRFLHAYHPLRGVLLGADAQRQTALIAALGRLLARLHQGGIEQRDGNLTNFLLGPEDDLMVVDEDDIRLYRGHLPVKQAVTNLANVAARLPDSNTAAVLLEAYLATAGHPADAWDNNGFWQQITRWRQLFESKRAARNIEARRRFD